MPPKKSKGSRLAQIKRDAKEAKADAQEMAQLKKDLEKRKQQAIQKALEEATKKLNLNPEGNGRRRRTRRKRGGSILDKLLDSNRLPELHLWSPWSGRHRYTGPGTKYEKYVDKNLNPLPQHMPINQTDWTAFRHDTSYHKSQTWDKPSKVQFRQQADQQMLSELSHIIRGKTQAKWGDRADAVLTYAPIWLKTKLGLGKKHRTKCGLKRKLYGKYHHAY